MIGMWIVGIAGMCAVASSILYLLSPHRPGMLRGARLCFSAALLGVVTASLLLLLYIVQHRFEYNYVASYSSRELPTALLITTFWAGQEGSLLLWALFSALIAIGVQRYSLKKSIEREVMAVLMPMLAFLLLLISFKSPFQYVWAVHPEEIPYGIIPPDGKGLNPLLQNIWMIIHPPVLFLGFALAAVPFAFALSALWKKMYFDWIPMALPWVLMCAGVLGAGLILGGYWAYGVLGWGGWWGWDPVENSSLVPWLVSVILLHTMLMQLMVKKFIRTNILLAIGTYLLVIYSTFLTRSGVLANASVHSFVDPGSFVYALLLGWLFAAVLPGAWLLWLRRTDVRPPASSSPFASRETILSLAMIVMGASAAIILFGTSLPLFSSATVEGSFYDTANFPLAVLMMIMVSVSLYLQWNRNEPSGLTHLLLPVSLSVLITAGCVIAGMHSVSAVMLVFTSLAALICAIEYGIRRVTVRWIFIGGALSHMGIAILLLGIIASGNYGQKQSVSLPLHQSKSVLGYTVTYTGDSLAGDGNMHLFVRVENAGTVHLLTPMITENSDHSVLRTPDYISFLTKDFYIEPVSLEAGSAEEPPQNILQLTKGEPVTYGPMRITFVRFDLGAAGGNSGMGTGTMKVGAVLELQTADGTEQVIPVTSYTAQGEPQMETVYGKSGHLGFQLVAMNVGMGGTKSKVHINIINKKDVPHPSAPDVCIAEVSVKPMMNGVWLGALLILCGLGIAAVRRAKNDRE